MSAYLTSGDYGAFGLPAATTAAQVQQASNLLDAYLKRPEGLVWTADSSGAPLYMVNLTPTMTFKLVGSVSPGLSVSVQVTPAIVTPFLVGEVLVLDRAGTAEACLVTGTSGNNGLTLQSVANSHNAQSTLESGLLIVEERELPNKRSVTRVSRTDVARIVSCIGRYGYGRRSEQVGGLYQEMNLLASVQTFGGPPQWIPVDATQCAISPTTGEVWVPAGMLMAYYSEVRLQYVAGWSSSNIPAPIKQATAQIVAGLQGVNSDMPAGVRSVKAGDTEIMRFASTLMDADTMASIDRYKARAFY